jgi:PEP-CTERM putative exosortase interaction domain
MMKHAPVAIGIVLLLGMSSVARADLSAYSSQVSFTAFNGNTGAGLASNYGTQNSALSNYFQTFTGSNSNGETQTMIVSASGAAAAAAGVLKASSSFSISNPYYNTANPVYVNPDFTTAASGSPDSFDLYSTARFDDSLIVNAAPSLASLQVTISLDGTTTYSSGLDTSVFGSPAYTQASVAVTDASGNACSTCGSGNIQGPGTFSKVFTLNIPVVDPAKVDLGIQLYMYNDFNLQYGNYSESTDYTVGMDFSHTLMVTGLAGLDSNGNSVALNSVSSSLGFAYPLAAVPEPSQALLMLAGLIGVAGVVRRRKQLY